MNESLDAWLEKAEEDFRLSQLAFRQRKHPAYYGTCFHAQQCAEKYLKAFLVRHQIAFRKTHDLEELVRLCVRIDAAFDLIADILAELNPYSIDSRYPGLPLTKADAQDAVKAMKQVRKFIRARLGLKSK